MSLLGISSDAWAGFGGAVIGGACTLSAQIVNDRFQRDAAKKTAANQAAASAILMQDDFWSYQATLARALDRCAWWKPEELLPRQASIDDRKTVLVALRDDETNTVANAQGWFDYLIGCRQALAGSTPPLTEHAVEDMKTTYNSLENGRTKLKRLAGRPAPPFKCSGVWRDLEHCKTPEQLLRQRCPP